MTLENPAILKKHDGKKTQIGNINTTRRLGGGAFGDVSQAAVSVGEGERSYHLAVKQFRRAGEAQKAFDAYCQMKDAGLKVPTTYRLDQKNNRIFMTDYERGDEVILSATNDQFYNEGFRIDTLQNLAELKDELMEQCALAARNRIYLSQDCFFFIAPKDGGNFNMDFVIGDVDVIFSGYSKRFKQDKKRFLKENQKNALSSMYAVIEKYET